jgi:hypothetical protein
MNQSHSCVVFSLVTWRVIEGEFAGSMQEILNDINYVGVPVFLFADPFGYSGELVYS